MLRATFRLLPCLAVFACACTVEVPADNAFPSAADDADVLAADADDAVAPDADVASADADTADTVGVDAAPDTDAAQDVDAAVDGTTVADADATTEVDAPGADAATDGGGDADGGGEDAGKSDADGDVAVDAGPCPVGCDDGVTCTTDSCDLSSGCTHVVSNAACDDGNGCTSDFCDLTAGCGHPFNGATCNDGSVCTTNDACSGGSCAGGPALNCNDGDACTTDSCDASAGCKHATVDCNDSNLCTNDACNAASGCVHLAIDPTTCDDGKLCTTDACAPATGCTHDANTLACDDGDACTKGDVCASGACASGSTLNCDDKNACSHDSCDKTKGCVNTPFTPSDCDDGKLCTFDSCVFATGCQHMAKSVADCTDNDKCTNDSCVEGIGCQHLPIDPTTCDDSNPCTTDSCAATVGCQHPNVTDGTACSVADVCTVLAKCTAGSCGGSPKLWATTFGGAAQDTANATAILASGAIAVGVTTASKTDAQDAWIFLRDAAGAPLWDKSFGGIGADTVTGMLASGNSVVFTGSTHQKTAGNADAWIGILSAADGSGTPVTVGGTGDDIANSIAAIPGGGFAIAGTTSSAEFGADPNGNAGWIARTDAAGKIIWSKAFSEWGDVVFHGVGADANGIYATGAATANFNPDLWIVHTDLNGKLLWSRRIDTGGSDIGMVAMPRSDGVAIAGWTNGKGAGDSDNWLLRLDVEGNTLWDRTYGSSGIDYLTAAVAMNDGYVLQSWTGCTTIRTDLSGTVLWSRSSSPVAANPQAFAVAATNDTIVMAGQNEANAFDAFVARFDAFGNLACSDSGVCAGKTASDCSDGVSCTSDACDAAGGGCHHANLGDGMLCDDGKSCTIDEACSGATCAAGKNRLFATTFGGALSDSANAVAVLSDGNIAVGAVTYSKTAGSADAWIFLRDKAGAALWDKSFGGSGNDTVSAVIANGANVLFVGTTNTNTAGGSDGWYGLLSGKDGSGTPVLVGGTNDDAYSAVARLSDGFVLAGSTASSLYSAYGTDGLLTRMDAFGQVAWSKAYNEVLDEVFVGVAADVTGCYAVGKTLGSNPDLWLVRTDLNGNKLWSRTVDTGGYDLGIVPMPLSSGLAVAGGTNGKGAGDSDFWLLRFDANGNKLWDRTYGNGGIDALQGAIATPDGGFLLHGWNYGNSQTVRTDASGDTLWFKSYNPTGVSSVGLAIASAGDGYVTAGHTEGSGGFDSQEVLLARFDRFGSADCTASGGCLGTLASSCDDGNTCTLDLCDANGGGCYHTNAADNARCDDGQACTMNEFCTLAACGSGVPTDLDGDGFPPLACGGTDCNDFNARINPSAIDFCDDGTVDDNCDGKTDNACTCDGFYWPIVSDNGHVCAIDGPLWGDRPENLDNLLVDNGDGTATDKQTKLMWHVASQAGVNFDQATAFCLASSAGGHSDWRMPTMAELSSLFDATKTSPAIASVFAPTTAAGAPCWSGWGDQGYDKVVDFDNDSTSDSGATSVHCVRGGPAIHRDARFTVTDTTVYDTFTKLTWERKPDLTTQFTFANAQAHCATLGLGGATWRLPTYPEQLGVITYGAGGTELANAFPNGLGNGTWSSTIPAFNASAVMGALIYYGMSGPQNKDGTMLAVCVH